MKNACLAVVLFCSTLSAIAAAPNPADYSITVSVIASESIPDTHDPGLTAQCINVIIDGKKYQLTGKSQGVLALGSYKAKLSSETQRNNYDIYRTYQFLMSDGKTRDFVLTGILE